MQKRYRMYWTTVAVVVVAGAGGFLPGARATAREAGEPQVFRSTAAHSSFLLAATYPRTGLQLDFSLRFEEPGVVFDTVGINGAPVGSWSVSVAGDGKLSAQVYDRGWHVVTAAATLARGRTYRGMLAFTGEELVLQVGDAAPQQVALKTTLSGQPVWIGDFPGDDGWGDRYRIHPAFIGTLTVHRIGTLQAANAPLPEAPAAGGSANNSEIIDETGTLTRDGHIDLLLALRRLELDHRVQLAFVIAAPAEASALQAHAEDLLRSLVERDILSKTRCGLFVLAGTVLRFHRDRELETIITGDMVGVAWANARTMPTRPLAAQRFLENLDATLKSQATPSTGGPATGGPATGGPATGGLATGGPATGGPATGGPATGGPSKVVPPTGTMGGLNLPTAGAVLATARIGPQGGVVEVGKALTLQFPPGALPREETIKVRVANGSLANGTQYYVEREGQGAMAAPVRVSFTLAPGVTAEQVSAVHQIAPTVWQVVPASFDASTRRLTLSVRSFSLVGWLMNVSMRTWVKLSGAGVGAAGGTITLLVFGGVSATAPVSVPATAFLVVCAAGGWFSAEPVYDTYREMGLVGPMRAVGFDIFWEAEPLAAAPRFVGIVGADGKVVDIANAAAKPPGVAALSVPQPIFELAGQLQAMQQWYRANGYNPPDNIPVLVHSKLGKAKEPGKAANAGEWDGRTLSIHMDGLKQGSDQQRLLATLAHEYWHAIFTHNGYKESFVGADDCLATTFESMVFPGSDDYLSLHPGIEFGRVVAGGVLAPAGDEGYTAPEMRGYALWPWGQFIYSSQGHEGLRELARGTLRPDLHSTLFVNFSRALITTDLAVPDPDSITQPDGTPEEFRTGWKVLSFGSLGIKHDPLVKPGRLDGTRARPLSLRRLVVEVPRREAGQPPSRLVVRRREPDAQEQIVLLKPAPAGTALLDIQRGLDDLVIGDPFALAAGAWTDDAAATVLQPVLLVGKSTGPLPPMAGNFLLAYKLAPPLSVAYAPVAATATEPARTRVTWTMSDPGQNLKTHDCFAGYRLLGKTKKGQIEAIAQLLYGPAVTRLNPPQWYRSEAGQVIALDAGQVSVEVPAAWTADYETLGLQTIDGVCREGGGPALSAIAWPAELDILAALRRTTTFYMRFTGAHSYQVTVTNGNTQTVRTVVETYPWVINGGYYAGQKLQWSDRNFSFAWTGSLVNSGEVFELPMAHGGSNADWSIALTNGVVDANGNLVSVSGKVTRTGQGYWDKGYVDAVSFTLHDLKITGKVIEPNRVAVSYSASGPTAAQFIRDMKGSRSMTRESWSYTGTNWNGTNPVPRVDLSFSLR